MNESVTALLFYSLPEERGAALLEKLSPHTGARLLAATPESLYPLDQNLVQVPFFIESSLCPENPFWYPSQTALHLSALSSGQRAALLASLHRQNPGYCTEVLNAIICPEALALLSNRTLQILLQGVNVQTLADMLLGCSDTVVEAFRKALSRWNGTQLLQDIVRPRHRWDNPLRSRLEFSRHVLHCIKEGRFHLPPENPGDVLPPWVDTALLKETPRGHTTLSGSPCPKFDALLQAFRAEVHALEPWTLKALLRAIEPNHAALLARLAGAELLQHMPEKQRPLVQAETAALEAQPHILRPRWECAIRQLRHHLCVIQKQGNTPTPELLQSVKWAAMGLFLKNDTELAALLQPMSDEALRAFAWFCTQEETPKDSLSKSILETLGRRTPGLRWHPWPEYSPTASALMEVNEGLRG